jgi:Zn-finger nucleic acid-binding protein
MTRDGYLGVQRMPIDRCDPCALLWLDAGELEAMAGLLERTRQRSAKRAAEAEARRREAAEVMDALLVTRARRRIGIGLSRRDRGAIWGPERSGDD